MLSESMRYKAFISYSHVHRDLAAALQVALERFGSPWYEHTGLRIFRDTAGLGATPDLWIEIRRALDDSEYFVLLASPEATASDWVIQEVDYWIGRHGSSRMIIVLASGVIVWEKASNDFDFAATTALPRCCSRAFTGIPLYVDFRGIRPTGYRLSNAPFLDKVATIASTLRGKSKDELYGLQVSALVVADARRMGAEAQLALNERSLQTCLRLATSALELTEAHGESRVRGAEAALRAALSRGGGRLLGATPAGAGSVAISPNGIWLATIGTDECVQVWDLSVAGDWEYRPWRLPDCMGVRQVKFSPDERWLITLGARGPEKATAWAVRLWDMKSKGQAHVELEVPAAGGLRHITVSDDGRYLAAATEDGSTIFVWDVATASAKSNVRASRTLSAGSKTVDFAFAVSGSAVSARGSDGTIRVWRIDEPRSATPILVHAGENVSSMCLAPDGRSLVTITYGKAPRLWRLKGDGTPHDVVDIESLQDLVHWVDMSPDGRWALLVSGSGPSYLVNLQSPDPIQTVAMIPTPGGSLRSHVFSADGNWLATAVGPTADYPEFHQIEEPDYTVRLLYLHASPTGVPMYELHGHDDLVIGLALSPETGRLITGSMDRTIRIWDIHELVRWVRYCRALADFQHDPRRASAELGIDPKVDVRAWLEEQQALAPHHDRTIREQLRASEPQILVEDGYVLSCELARGGSWLVTRSGTPDQALVARLWDLSIASTCAAPLRLSLAAQIDNFSRNQAFALSADHRQVLTLATSTVWEIDPNNKKTLLPVFPRATWFNPVQVALFAPDGDWLVLSPDRKGLVLCNLRDRRSTPELKLLVTGREGTQSGVRWADFSPDARWFIAECGSDIAGEPSELRAWDRPALKRGSRGKVILKSSDWLRPRGFSPDLRWFIAFEKGVGHAWNLTGRKLNGRARTLQGHSAPVEEMEFNPSGQQVVTGGKDGKVLHWDLENEKGTPSAIWAENSAPVHSLSVDWARGAALVGREDGSAQLLRGVSNAGVTETVAIPGHSGRVWGLLSTDGGWFATGDTTRIRLFDRVCLECRLSIPNRETRWFSGMMAWFTRDGKWFIAARQGQVFLVSLCGGEALSPVELRGHKYDRVIFRLSSDERWLVTADLWLEEPKGFEPISSCRIWDLWSPNPADSGVALPGLRQGVDRVTITKDDRWLITASPDGVRLWPLGTQHLLQLARRAMAPIPEDQTEGSRSAK
jgi:WD40 repeat protein